MYKSIIFDVDGTLIDGTEGILKSVRYTINQFGLEMPDDDKMLEFVGPPIQNSCKSIFNMNDEEAQAFANCFRKQYGERDVFYAKVYDGIYPLLEFLKQSGVKMGVATYKREDYALELMKHFKFDNYFTSICGADNENKLKKLDILVNCMNFMGASREETIMIGDSVHDSEAALKLNVKFIGVTYGFGFKTKKEIIPYSPLFSAQTPKDILEFFRLQK